VSLPSINCGRKKQGGCTTSEFFIDFTVVNKSNAEARYAVVIVFGNDYLPPGIEKAGVLHAVTPNALEVEVLVCIFKPLNFRW